MILASNDLSKVNIYYLHIEMVRIAHKIAHKCANSHIKKSYNKITDSVYGRDAQCVDCSIK